MADGWKIWLEVSLLYLLALAVPIVIPALVPVLPGPLKSDIMWYSSYSWVNHFALVAILAVALAFAGKKLSHYGISLKNVTKNTNVATSYIILLCVAPIVAMIGFILLVFLTNWTQTQAEGPGLDAIVMLGTIPVVFVCGLILLYAISRRLAGKPYREAAITIGKTALIICILSVGIVQIIVNYFQYVIVNLLVLLVLIGPLQELFFRGYLQTRLNDAFGRPYQFLGTSFGAGMIIAAVLYALMKATVLNLYFIDGIYGGQNFDAFASSFIFTFAFDLTFGMLMGLIKEKTGSVLAPAMVHGTFDFTGSMIGFLLGD